MIKPSLCHRGTLAPARYWCAITTTGLPYMFPVGNINSVKTILGLPALHSGEACGPHVVASASIRLTSAMNATFCYYDSKCN